MTAPHPPVRRRRSLKSLVRSAWRLEIGGLAVAVALALIAVWHVTASARSFMLYDSGDSMLLALIHSSMSVGQPQHWSFSAVLFLPELALYFAIAAVGLGLRATLAVNAIVNFLLLYLALRATSRLVGRSGDRSREIAGALLAFATLVALSLLDSSAGPDNLELSSLLALGTYYSATVIAMVLGTGLTAALMAGGTRRRIRFLAVALFVLSVISALSNPLYLAWFAAPIAILGFLLLVTRVASLKVITRAVGPLAVGSAIGMALRIPFASVIAQGAPYADPSRDLGVVVYYIKLLLDRISSPAGAISITVITMLIACDLCLLVRAIRHKNVARAVVAGMGIVAPAAVTIGVMLVGAVGARYLQPVYFAPILSLTLLAGASPASPILAGWGARRRTIAMVVALGTIAVGGTAAASGIYASATTTDPSIRCVDDWITASHQTGAGTFWAVRGPKAYLPDPRQLLQVDARFNGYTWLTNKADYSRQAVSFVLTDSSADAPTPRAQEKSLPHTVIQCGRYSITDYHRDVLTIGPLSSIPSAAIR